MSWWDNLLGGFGSQARMPLSVERDRTGNWFYKMFSSSGSFTSPTTDRMKIEMILRSPAALRVFKLNADLGSLGRVARYENDKFVEINALKKYQAKPNKHQTWKQWTWDYFFYSPIGTAYLWRSNNTNLTFSKTDFYWLNPAKIVWPDSLETKLDKLDLSDKAVNEIEKLHIQYQFKDGTTKDIPLKEIQVFTDLSNSVSENWYKGNSPIDALYKVISNADLALSANNVNLDFSRKFTLSGTQDADNVTQLPMGEIEKQDIKGKVYGEENVHVIKSKIDLNRFVSDLKNLGFDDTYLAQVAIIGSMFNIPRDVLDANLRGATYENQEKSTGKHISYSIQPKADDLMEWLGGFLGMELKMEYTHLPFMQYVEKEKAATTKTKAESFKIFIEGGFTKEEAAKLTGLEL